MSVYSHFGGVSRLEHECALLDVFRNSQIGKGRVAGENGY